MTENMNQQYSTIFKKKTKKHNNNTTTTYCNYILQILWFTIHGYHKCRFHLKLLMMMMIFLRYQTNMLSHILSARAGPLCSTPELNYDSVFVIHLLLTENCSFVKSLYCINRCIRFEKLYSSTYTKKARRLSYLLCPINGSCFLVMEPWNVLWEVVNELTGLWPLTLWIKYRLPSVVNYYPSASPGERLVWFLVLLCAGLSSPGCFLRIFVQ